MLTSVEGIYKNGRIELAKQLNDVLEGTKVIVTFIRSNEIDPAQAEALRTNLTTFVDDWNSDEMSIYDNYDAAKYRF